MMITMSERCLECGAKCEFAHIRDGQLLGCNRCIVTIPIHDYVAVKDEERGAENGKGMS